MRASKAAEVIIATDGELLMRFVRHRDQAAFAQIVERHGGLVWIVCREVLRHHQDIEDAFQATFFILAERAGSIRSSDSAAAWLYKVAQRTSLAARRKRSQRREEEMATEPPVGEEALFMLPERETLYVLLRELGGLPEHYRTPLVLRYLEGRSRRAIADQTDSTVAQIQGRLVRGRRMLRSRMLRRGVSLSIADGAIAGAAATAKAAVTPAVAVATAKSCLALTTTGAATGATAAAIQLAKQGAKAMWLATMMKTTAAVSTALVAAGVLWAAQAGGDREGANAAASEGAQLVKLNVAASADGHAAQPGAVIVPADDPDQPQQKSAIHAITFTGSTSKPLPPEMLRRTGLADALVAQQNIDVLVYAAQLKASISQLYGEQRKQIDALSEEKAELLTQMEVRRLEHSHMQREIEQLHKMLIELEFPAINKELDEKIQKERAAQIDRIRDRLAQDTNRLVDETGRIAKRTVHLERLQSDIARGQQRLDELDRRESQLQTESATAVNRPSGAVAPTTTANVAQGGLQTELRRAIIDVTGVPPTQEKIDATVNQIITQAPLLPDALIVQPMRTVRIRVAGTWPDAPIDGVFVVEPMGTVALGPQYGRVKVAGLPILEAEAAIKKELLKTLKDPAVQLTIAEPNATWEAAVPAPVGIALTPPPASAVPGWSAAPSNPLRNEATQSLHSQDSAGSIRVEAASPEQKARLEMERKAWQQKAEAYRIKATILEAQTREQGTVPAGQGKADALLLMADADHAEAMVLEIVQQLKVLAKPKPPSNLETQQLKLHVNSEPPSDLEASAFEGLQKENERLKKQLDDVKAQLEEANQAK